MILLASFAGFVYPGKLFSKSDPRHAEIMLPQAAGKKAVAVMPFKNLSADRDLDWLREGLADMLINTLSRSTRLAVLNRQQLRSILERSGHQPGDEVAPPAALGIARHPFRGREALSALFLSPLMIPHVVLGIAFLRFFTQTGVSGTFPALLVAHVVVVFPFALRLTLAAATGMDRSIEMAAVSLDEQGRREDAAWYRGLGRKLAEAYGREKDAAR
jgi:hypothetical protein